MAKKRIIILDPYTLDHVGVITKYTSISFTREASSSGSFEFWCDLSEENTELVKDGNLIYLDRDKVGVIQYIEEKTDEDGVKSLDIKGKTLKTYLSYRIILGTYYAKNKYLLDIPKDLIEQNFISPENENRKMPFIKISENYPVGTGSQVTMQKTGGEVLEFLEEIGASHSLFFDLSLDLATKEIVFDANMGINRTVNQSEIPPVVVSTDLKDILTSTYIKNTSNEKNVSLVAGAGEGVSRKILLVGETLKTGVDRKEAYVDARDISTTSTVDGKEVALTDEEYNLLLSDRGVSKLSEQKVVESFDASIRTSGATNYTYGVDYFLGDTITAIDKKLGVQMDAQVTSVEEVYSGTDGYSVHITFGYSQPTIMDKVKAVKKEANSSSSTSIVMQEIQEVNTLLGNKSNTSHTHDDRYNTKNEITTLLSNKQNSLGFTPVQQGGGANQGTNKVYLGWGIDGSGLRVQVDVTDLGALAFKGDLENYLPSTGGIINGNIEMNNHIIGGVNNIWLSPYADWLTNILNGKLSTFASCNRNWNWSGLGGQPTWIWGGEDGTNMYVYNPSNFNVNSATYANNLRASSTGRCLVVTKDNFLRIRLNGAGENGVVSVGSPNYRFAQVYVTASSISTSDRSLKDNINPLTDIHLEFFNKLIPVSFTFNDGTSGRTHIGFISQDVEGAMAECGLSDLDFAGFCKDKKVKSRLVKDEETGEYKEVDEDILDEDGNPEYIYSLRYEEFIALITYAVQKLTTEFEDYKNKTEERLGILESAMLKEEN